MPHNWRFNIWPDPAANEWTGYLEYRQENLPIWKRATNVGWKANTREELILRLEDELIQHRSVREGEQEYIYRGRGPV